MNTAENVKKNKLKCFSYVQKRNNYVVVQKISEIRVEGNMERRWPHKKQMCVILEDMMGCYVEFSHLHFIFVN